MVVRNKKKHKGKSKQRIRHKRQLPLNTAQIDSKCASEINEAVKEFHEAFQISIDSVAFKPHLMPPVVRLNLKFDSEYPANSLIYAEQAWEMLSSDPKQIFLLVTSEIEINKIGVSGREEYKRKLNMLIKGTNNSKQSAYLAKKTKNIYRMALIFLYFIDLQENEPKYHNQENLTDQLMRTREILIEVSSQFIYLIKGSNFLSGVLDWRPEKIVDCYIRTIIEFFGKYLDRAFIDRENLDNDLSIIRNVIIELFGNSKYFPTLRKTIKSYLKYDNILDSILSYCHIFLYYPLDVMNRLQTSNIHAIQEASTLEEIPTIRNLVAVAEDFYKIFTGMIESKQLTLIDSDEKITPITLCAYYGILSFNDLLKFLHSIYKAYMYDNKEVYTNLSYKDIVEIMDDMENIYRYQKSFYQLEMADWSIISISYKDHRIGNFSSKSLREHVELIIQDSKIDLISIQQLHDTYNSKQHSLIESLKKELLTEESLQEERTKQIRSSLEKKYAPHSLKKYTSKDSSSSADIIEEKIVDQVNPIFLEAFKRFKGKDYIGVINILETSQFELASERLEQNLFMLKCLSMKFHRTRNLLCTLNEKIQHKLNFLVNNQEHLDNPEIFKEQQRRDFIIIKSLKQCKEDSITYNVLVAEDKARLDIFSKLHQEVVSTLNHSQEWSLNLSSYTTLMNSQSCAEQEESLETWDAFSWIEAMVKVLLGSNYDLRLVKIYSQDLAQAWEMHIEDGRLIKKFGENCDEFLTTRRETIKILDIKSKKSSSNAELLKWIKEQSAQLSKHDLTLSKGLHSIDSSSSNDSPNIDTVLEAPENKAEEFPTSTLIATDCQKPPLQELPVVANTVKEITSMHASKAFFFNANAPEFSPMASDSDPRISSAPSVVRSMSPILPTRRDYEKIANKIEEIVSLIWEGEGQERMLLANHQQVKGCLLRALGGRFLGNSQPGDKTFEPLSYSTLKSDNELYKKLELIYRHCNRLKYCANKLTSILNEVKLQYEKPSEITNPQPTK